MRAATATTVGVALVLGVLALAAGTALAQQPATPATPEATPGQAEPTPVATASEQNADDDGDDAIEDNLAFLGIGVVVMVLLGVATVLALRRSGG